MTQKNPKKKRTNFWLSTTALSKLRRLAKNSGRSMSSYIEHKINTTKARRNAA